MSATPPVVRYYEETKAVIVAVNGYPIHIDMKQFPRDVMRPVVDLINQALHDAAVMDSLVGTDLLESAP